MGIKSVAQCSVDYSTTNYFCDLDSLFLYPVPLSGTGPWTYIWETGETTDTIMIPLAYGDYLLTATDATGCIVVINCHIKPFPQVLYYPFNQNGCSGDTVNLFLEWFRDSIPGATYLWSTGATTSSIQITDDITWSVTVTDPNNGCEFVIPPSFFDFHETNYPVIEGPNMVCTGQSITLTATGGPFGLIIWLPPNVYGPILEVTQPGEYIVWASSPTANYCWHQDTIVIEPGDIDLPILDGPPELCGGQNGVVSVINSNLFTSFNWSSGESSSSINVSTPGTYTVTVSNNGGCTATESITIGTNSGPQGTAIPTATTCGQSNGSIDLSVSPPSSYIYSWSNGMSSQDITNVLSGTYEVTITDLNGCSAIVQSIIPDQPIAIVINEVISPNTTCNLFNGAINLTVSPAATYTYAWSNGATTEDISNLAPGLYSITVATGVNCTASEDYVIADLSNAAEVTSSIIPATCGQANGNISLQLTGGTGPFTYLWSNGNTTDQIIDVVAGNYSVTVTGADGCTTIHNSFIPDDTIPINITADIISNTSCTSSNGAIDITVSPTETYNYAWSTGSTNEDLFNLNAGTYSVTVTFGNTCLQTGDFTVNNENIPFTITGITFPNTSCQSPNGSIDLNIQPVGSYTISWSNGSGSEDLQNLDTGQYQVTVTNIDGCSITSNYIIDSQTPVILLTGITVSNTSCVGPNGSIDLAVLPAGNYFYQWNTGQTTEDLLNLSDTLYTVMVTDANQCSATGSYVILNDAPQLTLASTIQNESCLAGNGSIQLDVNPGGNSYLWSTGATTEDLSAIPSGQYWVTITSANGCVSLDTFLVSNSNTNFSSNGLPIDNTSCLTPNGSIDLSVQPAGNYTFQWSTGASTEDINQLAGGVYTVTITDLSNCSSTTNFVLSNLTVDPVINEIITPSKCNNNNGAIDITVTPAQNNTFIWSNGEITEDIQNVAQGNYSVTITGENGCTAIANFTVPNLDSGLSITGSTGDDTNCSIDNGSIDLQIFPAGVYSIAWSTGDSAEDISGLSQGMYSVTVTDTYGCTGSSEFSIGENLSLPSIESTVLPASCGQPNGSIDITVLPTDNYQFTWSNGSTSEDLFSLIAGAYEVTVTSSNGCTSFAVFNVQDQNSNFTISTEIIDNASCIISSGSIDLTISPAGNYTFLWSNGATTEDLINISSGIYAVTVTDGFQCAAHDEFNIEDLASIPSLMANATGTSCGDRNGSIDVSVLPPGNYQYSWSTGDQTEDLYNQDPGTYSITISDENGCSAQGNFIINGSTPLDVSIDLNVIEQSEGIFNCTLQINRPLSAIQQIDWSPLELMSCQSPLCMEQTISITGITEINVLVMDTNGCMGTARLVLNIIKDFQVYIPNVFSPNGDGSNDWFTIFTNEEIKEIVELEIFDRWGNNVFAKAKFPPNDPLLGWDGNFKNNEMNPAVFAYRAVVRDSSDELHHYKGDVTLIR